MWKNLRTAKKSINHYNQLLFNVEERIYTDVYRNIILFY